MRRLEIWVFVDEHYEKPKGPPRVSIDSTFSSIRLHDDRNLVWLQAYANWVPKRSGVGMRKPRRLGKRTIAYYTKVLKDLWLVKWGET